MLQNLFYILCGLLGTTTITGGITTVIFYLHKFEEMTCGDLQKGVAVGLVSMLGLLLNFIIYLLGCCGSCSRKCIIIFFGVCVIASFIYNYILYIGIEKDCKDYYKDKNLWEFYNYYLVTLFFNAIFVIGISILYCKIKNKVEPT